MTTSTDDLTSVRIATPQLIAAMLQGRGHVSDLIFSPGRAPQVETKGELIEIPFQGIEVLSPKQTIEIAEDLIGSNTIAAQQLKSNGSADLSYALPGVARFRVNVFRQRASCAIVMALGAASRHVLRDVLGDALRLTAVGAAIGFLGGYLTAVLMKSWLFETRPFDPIGYFAVAALVGSAAIAAAWVPARRAASIDPAEALR